MKNDIKIADEEIAEDNEKISTLLRPKVLDINAITSAHSKVAMGCKQKEELSKELHQLQLGKVIFQCNKIDHIAFRERERESYSEGGGGGGKCKYIFCPKSFVYDKYICLRKLFQIFILDDYLLIFINLILHFLC